MKKLAGFGGGLALAALLAGCVSPGLAARERSLAQRLEKSLPPAPQDAADDPFRGHATLDRAALVREVLRRNPGLEAARSGWRAALARYPQEIALEDPMLETAIGPASFGSDEVDPGFRVELSQALPFPGKRGLRGEVALAEAEAAEHEYQEERLRLAATASQLFDEYYLAARAAELNARHRELVEELSSAALARYEAGSAMQQDALLAETELAELLHGDVLLGTAQRRAAERINTLLHRSPEQPLPPPPASLEVPEEGELDAAALTERALAQRPELRALRARVAAREQSLALARRELLPDFTVSAGYDRFWQEEPLQPMVGLAVNIPLALGRRRGALEQADAELARARAETQRAEDAVRLAVARGVDRLREAHHLIELTRGRMLPVARDRIAASRAAFESGQGSFLELIDSERRLRSAELEYEQAIATLWSRHAELDLASADLDALAAEVRP
jgi:outer membrane protein TolC